MDTGHGLFATLPPEIKLMIYRETGVTFDTQRLVVLQVVDLVDDAPDTEDEDPPKSEGSTDDQRDGAAGKLPAHDQDCEEGGTESVEGTLASCISGSLDEGLPDDCPPGAEDADDGVSEDESLELYRPQRCTFEVKNAEALTENDPYQLAEKFRLLNHGLSIVEDAQPRKVVGGAHGSRSALDGYHLSSSRDIFFLFDVPTTYVWSHDEDYEQWLSDADGIFGLDPNSRREPTRQLCVEESVVFSELEIIMLSAKEVLDVMDDVLENNRDLLGMDLYGQFSHHMSAWQAMAVQDWNLTKLKRLVVLVDDGTTGAVERLKDGKVGMEDLILQDASQYWTSIDPPGRPTVIHDTQVIEQEWGPSVSEVCRLWALCLDERTEWQEEQAEGRTYSWYEFLDLPELWLARIKEH